LETDQCNFVNGIFLYQSLSLWLKNLRNNRSPSFLDTWYGSVLKLYTP